MKRFVRVAILLLATIAVATSAYAQQPASGSSTDRIYDQVQMRLATDPDIKGGALNVVVKGGVVTLSGRVDTQKGKLRATKVTKKVKGVTAVDNDLVVGPPK
jgi:osmotically-inducible protein OsmY